ncbi:CHAT domain-containing protein [Mycena filopes]|nr:CHAT domain-containing protein [Mycena filopes]
MIHTGLATAYSDRFKAFHRIEDLQDAIAQYFLAVKIGPQIDRNYANSHLGDIDDLNTAVPLIRETDTQRTTLTLALADALQQSFNHSGELNELEEAMVFYRAVVAMVLAIGNLASAHHSRFERLNENADLGSAIYLQEVLLTLVAEGNPNRSSILNNLGNALLADLKKALDLNRAMALISLARGLFASFTETGRFEELDEGIAQYREAISILPEGHRHQSVAFQNLANLLAAKFAYLGQRRDLEEALALAGQNLEFHPLGDASRPSALAALADILLQRFHCFGIIGDLKQTVEYLAEALESCPPEHAKRASYLHDFACAMQVIYTHFPGPGPLEAALVNHALALSLRPVGHAKRAPSLKGLAEAYCARFKRFGRIEDLEAAITHAREALSLRPAGHPRHFAYLNELAVDLTIRFDHLDEMSDLEEAIALLTAAKASIAKTAPAQSRLDRHLAISYLKQHDGQPRPNASLLATAFGHFEAGFAHAFADPGEAVQTLLDWATAARTHGRRVPLQAYSRALALLEQTIAVTATIDMQHRSLTAPGAPQTIAMGSWRPAVELLEQGRAMLWTRMRGYRSALDDLHQADAVLAEEFEKITKQLEALTMSVENASEDDKGRMLDLNRTMKARRELQERWDELVRDIQQLDGFESFLQPVPFKTLRAAAEGGPVVMINVSEHRCDALILQEQGPPNVVPLPDLTLDGLRELTRRFLNARGRANSRELVVILRTLWKNVVQPIVVALQTLAVPRNTRIWWCPTSFLCAFPLHAAGMYTKAEPDANVPNLFISSYTPTLSALIQARSNIKPNPHGVQLLVVGEPAEDLPSVDAEIAEITSLGTFVNTLVGDAATPLRVLAALQQHSYTHFACHASQHAREPFQSAFRLHAGAQLRLLDVVQARLPQADFAFLSACETATGDVGAPDEAIHLAAAMQFAGFRSVVGTLWQMPDMDGPFVAREFYGHLFREGGGIADFRDSAAALHGAMRALRKKDPQSVGRWINFIHVGA